MLNESICVVPIAVCAWGGRRKMHVVLAVFDAVAALVESPLDEAGLRLLDGRAFVVDERLVQGHIGLLAVEGFSESKFQP